MALAPIAVEVVTYLPLKILDSVKAMVDEAEYHLHDGETLKVWPLVAKLASKTLLHTTKMPLSLGILTLMIGMWFSRQRDFRTNTGCGQAGGVKRLFMTHRLREKPIAALKFSGDC